MNEHFRLIRHSDSAWHDRFFDFVASIFKVGRTFSDWGARGGWVDGYDVFAMVIDNEIVSTVGRQSMQYVINGRARHGYQIGAVATHSNHRNHGLARLLMKKALSQRGAPDQPVILFANPSVLDPLWCNIDAKTRKLRKRSAMPLAASRTDADHQSTNRSSMHSACTLRCLRYSRWLLGMQVSPSARLAIALTIESGADTQSS